jgi:drug/metabolite transporter (DMT)-like permease
VVASLCYAVSYVYMDRFLISRQLSPVTLAGAQLLAASGLAVLALPLVDGWKVPAWRADALLALIALGVLGTGIAYVLNYRIIADDGASAASLVTYLLPITAVVLGAVVLQEKPTTHAIIGVGIVLSGVALARRSTGTGGSRRASSGSAHNPADASG